MTNKRYQDFIIIFRNPILNGFYNPKDYLEKINNSNHLKSLLRYLIFQWEINPNEINENYYQMYFEFTNNMSVKRIQNDFFNGINVEISPFDGNKEEAIEKCSNQKNLFAKGYFHLGEPKRSYSLTNRDNKNIPLTHKEQIMHVIDEVKKGTYKSLKDIEEDYPYISYKEQILLQNILIRNNPFNSEVDPAKVIWVYGNAGCGKTTWTNKYLRDNNCDGFITTRISPSSLNSYGNVWFNLDDENRKVLVINEVDRTFPKYNNLIAWIDRGELLPVKNSQIRNNYELIIVNSIYSPEEVFSSLGKRTAGQILRRIFNSETKSRVYKITANEEQLKEAENLELSRIEFSKWYQPKMELIKEADYSLMKD